MKLFRTFRAYVMFALASGLLLAAGGIFNQQADAAATYSYASSGSKITVKYNGNNYNLAKQPVQTAGKDSYVGSIEVDWTSGDTCMLGVQVLASGGSSASVSTPAFLNGLAGAGNSGQTYVQSCPRDFASSQTEFNKNISIGGSTGDSTEAPSSPETAGQKEVIVQVYSPVDNPPAATITKTQEGSSGSERKNIEWNSSNSTASVIWAGVEAGTKMTFCISPTSIFDTQNCKSGTKERGKPLIITFGSFENSYNEDGKKVDVTVNFHVKSAPTPTTYGPISLVLFNVSTSESVSTETTGSKDFGETGVTPEQNSFVNATFDGIEPGTYRVCLRDDESICSSNFEKRTNMSASTVINLTDEQSEEFATSSEDRVTCAVEGIGWIVCPVMNFMANIVDSAYAFVASLLEVQPFLTSGATVGVYDAWIVMRNISNIAFVIVFLIIIFSQLTSFGVSNYGVKKMLPRLVIAAILVNVSYWVCALAVDLSNIFGTSVNGIFAAIGDSIPNGPNAVTIDDTGEGWIGVVGAVLAGTVGVVGIYYVGLSALIPALLAALVAIVTVFLVLTLRQALIILLVVISPLAFVAYLLPNTEGLFTSWRKLFMTLLLMYPIIAGIFGASALASDIVMQSASGDYKIAIQVMGALISILPLAITPVVMKAAGGVLNRFAGIVNNTEKGPVDRLRNLGDGYRKKRQNLRDARALNGAGQLGRGAFTRWRARRGAVAQSYESEKNRANTGYIADQMQNNDRFRQAAAGGASASPEATQRVLANAINAQSKLEADEISAASVVVKDAQFSKAELRELANGGTVKGMDAGRSTALRAAAIQSVVASNDVEHMNSLWDQSRTWEGPEGNKLRQVFADSLQSSSGRPAYYGQGAIAEMRTGSENHRQGSAKKTIIEALKNNAYSPSKLASADKDELGEVAKVLRDSTPEELPAETVLNLRKNANTALTDTELSAVVSKNRTVLQELQGNQGQPASPLITPDNPEFRVR